jgi:peptide chain release factor subunit 3
MPNKVPVEIAWIFNSEEKGVPYAKPGEVVRLKLKGCENEQEINRGNILCSADDLCPYFQVFEAEIFLLTLPESKKIMSNGYLCNIHMHTIIEECSIDVIAEIDKKTKEDVKVKFIKSNSRAKVRVTVNNVVCAEKFENYPMLGRFTIRDEGNTIGIGKILRYKPMK